MVHGTYKTSQIPAPIWYQSLWPVSSALSASGFPILDFLPEGLGAHGAVLLRDAMPWSTAIEIPQGGLERRSRNLLATEDPRANSLCSNVQVRFPHRHPSIIQSTWLFSFWFLDSCMQQRDNKLSAGNKLPKGLALTWAKLTSWPV